MVLTTLAPYSVSVTQVPSLENNATEPSGFNAPTDASGRPGHRERVG